MKKTGCLSWNTEEREQNLRLCSKSLVARYGLPRHGNKSNPLDEVVYILLSSQTDEAKYQKAYSNLKGAFASWKTIKSGDEIRIARILEPAGLSKVKASRIVSILFKIESDFGVRSLAHLKRMSNAEAEKYLCSLDGIGKKSARCVLMYSMGRNVFPVDTHTFRILKRLGAHDLPLPERRWHDAIQDMIPAEIRYSLHVTLVALGRDICKATRPLCSDCSVMELCVSFKRALLR